MEIVKEGENSGRGGTALEESREGEDNERERKKARGGGHSEVATPRRGSDGRRPRSADQKVTRWYKSDDMMLAPTNQKIGHGAKGIILLARRVPHFPESITARSLLLLSTRARYLGGHPGEWGVSVLKRCGGST